MSNNFRVLFGTLLPNFLLILNEPQKHCPHKITEKFLGKQVSVPPVSCMLMGSLLLPTCPFHTICPWLFRSLGFCCRASLLLLVVGIYLFASLDNPQRSCLSQHCHLGVGDKEREVLCEE